MVQVESAVATSEMLRGATPLCSARLELGFGDVEVEGAGLGIERDEVAILHESERAADEAFGRDMQDAGSVRGAAHAGIGYADHISDALLQHFLRQGQHSPFGHAGTTERAGILQHEHRVLVDSRDRRGSLRGFHVVVVLEHDGRAGVLHEARSGSGGFDNCSIGREVAVEDGGAAGVRAAHCRAGGSRLA